MHTSGVLQRPTTAKAPKTSKIYLGETASFARQLWFLDWCWWAILVKTMVSSHISPLTLASPSISADIFLSKWQRPQVHPRGDAMWIICTESTSDQASSKNLNSIQSQELMRRWIAVDTTKETSNRDAARVTASTRRKRHRSQAVFNGWRSQRPLTDGMLQSRTPWDGLPVEVESDDKCCQTNSKSRIAPGHTRTNCY